MSSALLVGAGAAGAHAGRHLVATPGLDRLLVADVDPDRARRLAGELGEVAEVVRWSSAEPLPEGIDVVACAVPDDLDVPVAERAVEAGVALATCGETRRGVERLLALDSAAREAGVAVATGAGLAPGLSEVLAAYGSRTLDAVDEVHVARFGTAGRACLERRRAASWGRSRELRDGTWIEVPAGRSVRLVYFPGPVGPHDCRRVAGAVPRLVAAALPGVSTVSSRAAMRRTDRVTGRTAPVPGGGRLGAVFVEVRGRRGSSHEVLTYGAVDRAAAVTGAVLAAAAAAVGRLGGGVGEAPTGAAPLAALAEPDVLLAELARRGVRTARFEGGDAGVTSPPRPSRPAGVAAEHR